MTNANDDTTSSSNPDPAREDSPDPAGMVDLIDVLTLKPVGEDRFEGMSHDFGTGRVFGGQVLGQALAAAYGTVDGAQQRAHSMHAYFLRPGDHSAPIEYEVDRQRDGRSYANRRVVARQGGRPIFNLAASFHRDETGPDHQRPMPVAPPPERVRDLGSWIDDVTATHGGRSVPTWVMRLRGAEFRPVQAPVLLSGDPGDARSLIWFRIGELRSDFPGLDLCLLALLSDFWLLAVSVRPHLRRDRRFSMASLDHAMWFHRSFEPEDWLLYSIESPSATTGRGLSRGEIYTRDGRLVAAVAQEGVTRWAEPAAGRNDA